MKENKTFSEKFNAFMLTDYAFILLLSGVCAAVMASVYLYLNHGTGINSSPGAVTLLTDGIETGDYSGVTAFAGSYLFARVIEGPLVGLLDIGGSLMTGVGLGLTGLLLSLGFEVVFSNFYLALLTGAVIGLVLSFVIFLIRKLLPSGFSMGGTSILMGAGNACGRYFAPLVIISATQFNVYAGLGSVIGSAVFYKLGVEYTGGAILGAMILGGIFI